MHVCGYLVIAVLFNFANAAYNVIESNTLPGHRIRVKRFRAGEVCDTGANHFAGWADIGVNHLFYWFHEARHDKQDKPLMIWLQGGPGTASTAEGLLAEHGPCRATENASDGLVYNPHSWTELFNIIYVDQPSGTGYSYTNSGATLHSRSEESSLDLVALLILFQEAFPEYQNRSLYVAGESYAGRFIPLLADAIIRHNQGVKAIIPLTGLLIGNGWTAPTVQYPSLYEVGCHPYLDLPNYFNSTECRQIAAIYDRCQKLMDTCELVPDGIICSAAGELCASYIDIDNYRPNDMFDRRRTCDPPDACFGKENNAVDWLNSDEARQAFEIREQTGRDIVVEGISLAVFNSFRASGDYFTSSTPELARVLDFSAQEKAGGFPGIDVLYYTGVTDIVCNPVGVRRLLEKTKWARHAEFMGTPWEDLKWSTSEGHIAGRMKAVHGLWMAELADAGHMAPNDQPESVLKLLEFWMDARSIPKRTSLNALYSTGDKIYTPGTAQMSLGDTSLGITRSNN